MKRESAGNAGMTSHHHMKRDGERENMVGNFINGSQFGEKRRAKSDEKRSDKPERILSWEKSDNISRERKKIVFFCRENWKKAKGRGKEISLAHFLRDFTRFVSRTILFF